MQVRAEGRAQAARPRSFLSTLQPTPFPPLASPMPSRPRPPLEPLRQSPRAACQPTLRILCAEAFSRQLASVFNTHRILHYLFLMIKNT